jgi:hypothetical protein
VAIAQAAFCVDDGDYPERAFATLDLQFYDLCSASRRQS